MTRCRFESPVSLSSAAATVNIDSADVLTRVGLRGISSAG